MMENAEWRNEKNFGIFTEVSLAKYEPRTHPSTRTSPSGIPIGGSYQANLRHTELSA